MIQSHISFLSEFRIYISDGVADCKMRSLLASEAMHVSESGRMKKQMRLDQSVRSSWRPEQICRLDAKLSTRLAASAVPHLGFNGLSEAGWRFFGWWQSMIISGIIVSCCFALPLASG